MRTYHFAAKRKVGRCERRRAVAHSFSAGKYWLFAFLIPAFHINPLNTNLRFHKASKAGPKQMVGMAVPGRPIYELHHVGAQRAETWTQAIPRLRDEPHAHSFSQRENTGLWAFKKHTTQIARTKFSLQTTTNLYQMITQAQLESMFANIAEKTPWDLKGEMLWGYFFKSPTEAALAPIAEELEAKGYTLVGIREEDDHQWWLHVEQVEPHSVETLLQRNAEFYTLAESHKVEYDGMDVGPTVLED